MSTITKEQLIAHITPKLARIKPDSQVNDDLRNEALMNKRVFEIVLAALTAAPAAWTDEVELEDMESTGRAYIFKSRRAMGKPDPGSVVKLYRLPLLED